jgi:hypothetical protein
MRIEATAKQTALKCGTYAISSAVRLRQDGPGSVSFVAAIDLKGHFRSFAMVERSFQGTDNLKWLIRKNNRR